MKELVDKYGTVIKSGDRIALNGKGKEYKVKEKSGKLYWPNGEEMSHTDGIDKFWEKVR